MTKKIAYGGMFAALSFLGFYIFRIDIVIAGGKTALHLGNSMLVLSALLLGPFYGALSGALGMTIADLVTGYAMYAPTTFLLKMVIGMITGGLAHKHFDIMQQNEKSALLKCAAISIIAGLFFNIIADPLINLLVFKYIYLIDFSVVKKLSLFALMTTTVNAVVAVVVAAPLFVALKKPFQSLY